MAFQIPAPSPKKSLLNRFLDYLTLRTPEPQPTPLQVENGSLKATNRRLLEENAELPFLRATLEKTQETLERVLVSNQRLVTENLDLSSGNSKLARDTAANR